MSDSAKQLISAVASSWNERAASLLGVPSQLSLLASRDVSGDGMAAALAVAMTWSSGFAATCSGASGGVIICLFKSDEAQEIDRLVKQPGDGLPRPGGRALIESVLEGAAATLAGDPAAKLQFDSVSHLDLTIDDQRLAAIVGDAAHIGTFSLSIGDEINSQALMLYAPNGSLTEPSTGAPTAATHNVSSPIEENGASTANAAPVPHNGTRRNQTQRRNEPGPRNMERLLEVELDVVVRFGITSVLLRDIVRMGVGTMIELNRAVDEPVELLVNGRSLARGEVVVVDGYYGVRITEIGPVSERAASIV